MDNIKFHDILKKHLSNKNLAQVSRDTGIKASLLFDWVKARRSPRLDNAEAIKKLADYLGLDFEYMFFGDGSNSVETIGIIKHNELEIRVSVREGVKHG